MKNFYKKTYNKLTTTNYYFIIMKYYISREDETIYE